MDLNSALDIIIRDLREAREIIDDLKNVKGVSVIQVELAKSKCKSAEEIIELLKTIEQPVIKAPSVTPAQALEVSASTMSETSAPDVSGSFGKPAAEQAEPAPASGDVAEDIRPESLMELEDEPAEAAAAAETPETDESVKDPEPVEPAAVSQKDEKKSVKGKPILADRYGEPYDRVNERMRGTRGDNDISAKLKQSPISNLAEAIGVNDRFFYIREVFGGNNEAYHTAMEKLNSVSSSGEAENIIHDYSSGEADTAAVKSLLDLVRRKTGFNG
ncbi:MAG: hypothetical protein R6W67_03355 [Bacteroidales bacterium]